MTESHRTDCAEAGGCLLPRNSVLIRAPIVRGG